MDKDHLLFSDRKIAFDDTNVDFKREDFHQLMIVYVLIVQRNPSEKESLMRNVITNQVTKKPLREETLAAIIEALKNFEYKIDLFRIIAQISPPPEWDLEVPEHSIPSPFYCLLSLTENSLQRHDIDGHQIRRYLQVMIETWNMNSSHRDDLPRMLDAFEFHIKNINSCVWNKRIFPAIRSLFLD